VNLKRYFSPFKNRHEQPIRYAFSLRAIEISMGFVFLMGAWRRFFNMPIKHEIESGGHLANKLVMAAPGSPIEGAVHWVLYDPFLAEWSVYFMSAAEAVIGSAMILGLFSRLAAFGSAAMNVALMLIFGWMGYECLDEWTMAALGFAISISLVIYGSNTYSLDSKFGVDPFRSLVTKRVSAVLTVLSIVFTVGFYSYYFGIFHFQKLTHTKVYTVVAQETADDDVYTLYVSAGGSSSPAYLTDIVFHMEDGSTITEIPEQVEVLRSHFEPWSHGSGKVVNGLMRLSLGSKVDIRVPDGAVSADINLLDNKKQNVVHFD